MIFSESKKEIQVMFTPFRDGLQSVFGGKTRLGDILPAIEASAVAGIRHFEFGGGARFQAPFFYVGEDPFDCMSTIRKTVGPDVDLQILTRSVSGVTLTTQRTSALALQAKLMQKHGTTIDRNFDFMNDVDNLVKTGRSIVDSGMHHQVCVALMGLPFQSDKAHTPEFYINIVRELLRRDIHFDSVCLKDASGTTDPHICYETAKGIKAILPPEIPLIQHTHDTASTAVACYMAGIAGGVDGIDLAVRPLASGTSQPDVRSMAHALKGTGYSLDVDPAKMDEIESLLNDGLSEYEFNPVTTSADARVVGFPMPGGAIGPNVHMMKSAGILDKYGAVLAEFPEVVRAGGGWTSVTPGSQQYWLQAFNNVLHGRWEKIDAGYGKSVLGYFGRPPLPPDPEVVKIASAQLELPTFDGDPLEEAPDTLTEAEAALKERGIEVTDESKFLVAAAIVPGKNMELNEGIRLLEGRPKITLPLKKKEPPAGISALTVPTKTSVTVNTEGGARTYEVIIEPPVSATAATPSQASAPASGGGQATDVFSPFDGNVELVEISAKAGDTVTAGQVVAAVEAMKAKHDVKAPCSGRVSAVHAAIGSEVSAGKPILSIEA
ncbi:MAG: biotin/lipoyl-containing protein [Verrucomicrobiota bacterium]|nr:biotin/lipoyl-containing protein [Verrucomicrobiota bacterium]